MAGQGLCATGTARQLSRLRIFEVYMLQPGCCADVGTVKASLGVPIEVALAVHTCCAGQAVRALSDWTVCTGDRGTSELLQYERKYRAAVLCRE